MEKEIKSVTEKYESYSNIISPEEVHSTIGKYMLADGFAFVLDLKNSHGSRIIDEKTGEEYIDLFTFFASNPIGMNHPAINNEKFKNRNVSDNDLPVVPAIKSASGVCMHQINGYRFSIFPTQGGRPPIMPRPQPGP